MVHRPESPIEFIANSPGVTPFGKRAGGFACIIDLALLESQLPAQ